MTDNNFVDQYKTWYDFSVATGTDTFNKFYYHIQNQFHSLPLAGKRVLEVGCGKGAVSLFLAAFSGAKQVVALDEGGWEGATCGGHQCA